MAVQPTITETTQVSVLDPENANNMPIFEGELREVSKRLVPGLFAAFVLTEDDEDVKVALEVIENGVIVITEQGKVEFCAQD